MNFLIGLIIVICILAVLIAYWQFFVAVLFLISTIILIIYYLPKNREKRAEQKIIDAQEKKLEQQKKVEIDKIASVENLVEIKLAETELELKKQKLLLKELELDDVKQTILQQEKSTIPKHLIRISVDDELIKIDQLSGHEFEHYCATLLENIEYRNVSVTTGSGDQGIDVLAEMGTTRYGYQCKNVQYPVGNKAVQEAIAGKEYYRINKVGVITNNYFTASAKDLAQKANVELWDRDTLKEILEDTFISFNKETS